MGNQMIMLLVVGSLLGLFGGNAISNLNPFKAGRVAVTKQEAQKEEYFKDRVKGIEYKMIERSKGQTPAKQTLGSSIGSFVDKSIKAIISFALILFLGSLLFGVNLFSYVRKLRKTLTQLIVGTQNAKTKMNGEEKTLSNELASSMDEASKKLVRDIKSEKSI